MLAVNGASSWVPDVREAGLLRTIVEGGLWRPYSLARFGYREEPSYSLCGHPVYNADLIICECPHLIAAGEQHLRGVDLRGFPQQQAGVLMWSGGLIG
eukprot:7584846-Pyramimonas_sp.AAC.1